MHRISGTEVSLRKRVLEICSKFTGEHPCRSVISIKLQRNFFEIALRHGCSPVNLLLIFKTCFLKNTSGRLPSNTVKRKRMYNGYGITFDWAGSRNFCNLFPGNVTVFVVDNNSSRSLNIVKITLSVKSKTNWWY